MKIEAQVTSLELSMILKELGVKQKSLFYWYTSESGVAHLENKPSNNKELWDSCSAFTIAELGEMLPVVTENPPYTIHYLKQGNSGLWTLMSIGK
jgi:hypothetical protein